MTYLPAPIKLLLLAITAAARIGADPLSLSESQDLRSCILDAVSSDSELAHFQDWPDFIANDVKHYNLNLLYKPFAVAYPKTIDQISAILRCSTKYGHKVQARSGGHDQTNKYLGGADDAVVIDMKSFNQLELDEKSNIVKVGPGIHLGTLLQYLHKYKRFIPHGFCAPVGVGGHATVGGYGYSSRNHGLTIDTVEEMEVVLANGTITRTTADTHPDLFWAMRGAGASMGIATEFKLLTKPEPKEFVSFKYEYDSKDPVVISEAVQAYHQIMSAPDLPNNLFGSGILERNIFTFRGALEGTQEEFDALNMDDRMPVATSVSKTPRVSWLDYMSPIFKTPDPLSIPSHQYVRSMVASENTMPSNSSIKNYVQHLFDNDDGTSKWIFMFGWFGGDEVKKVPQDATAFPHRDTVYLLSGNVRTPAKTSEKTMNFLDDSFLALQNNEPDKYPAYAGVAGRRLKNPQDKYWRSNLPRLEKIKAALDPGDLFSAPQNIKPYKGD